MGVRADAADVLGARARQDGELEDDVHVHLGDDDERFTVRKRIQRGVHSALDGVFDGDDSPVGLAAAHGRERLGCAGHRYEDGACGRYLVDGLLGKGAEGSEERDSELVAEGCGAGDVRRHGIKGIDTRSARARSVPAQERIVVYSSSDWGLSVDSAPGWTDLMPSANAWLPPPGVT